MVGTKVRMWKQDPTVEPIGVRTAYIHTSVRDGPRDDVIEIRGMPVVRGDENRDFLRDPETNPIAFDAVHTFTVVRQVLTMFQRALRRSEVTDALGWQWGPAQPIAVFPHAGVDQNAFYSREERALRFFHFHPHNDVSRPQVFTARSFDIVAHETGHAVLDALRPGYWTSTHAQTGGLHEAFGDVTAILTMLAQMDQCEAIIAESKGDLHEKTFFNAVAEQFGQALFGHEFGLRNADNDLTLRDVSNEVHEISQVFTGAFYDILADIYVAYRDLTRFDPAETLFRVGKHMTALLILAITTGPARNATFRDIANRMIEIEPEPAWQDFIIAEFTRRDVLAAPTNLAAAPLKDLEWGTCCGTMQHQMRVAVGG